MKAVVAAFNQEKAFVGSFSVITKLRVDLRLQLYSSPVDDEFPERGPHDDLGVGVLVQHLSA